MEENNVINLRELVCNMKTVPQEYKTSKELFAECANQQRFDLIVQFDNSLLTEDFIKSNIKKIMEELYRKFPENLKTNRLLFDEVIEYKYNYYSVGASLKIISQFDNSLFEDEKCIEEIMDDYRPGYTSKKNFFPGFRSSKVLFDKCVEMNRYDLIFYFDCSLLTEEFISRHLDKIINELLNYTPEGFGESEFFSQVLFEECLNHMDNLHVRNFLRLFDVSLITEELVQKNPDIVNKMLREMCCGFRTPFSKSKLLLEECARQRRDYLLLKFDKSLFTDDFIKKYSEIILISLERESSYPLYFEKSKALLEACAEQKRTKLLLNFDDSLYTEDFIEKNFELILTSSDGFALKKFWNSKEFLNVCARQKRTDLLLKLNKELFTEDFIKEYSEVILDSLNNTIIPEFKASKALMEACVRPERFLLLFQFDKSLFTEEFIISNLKFIITEVTNRNYLPNQLNSSKVLFYIFFKQKNFNLLTKFSSQFFTDEFVTSNLSWIMDNIKDNIPYSLCYSQVLFDEYYKQKNFNLLFQFDDPLFTEEFIADNIDFFMDNLTDDLLGNRCFLENGVFYSSKALFFESVKRNRNDLIAQLNDEFWSEAFIQDNLQLYVSKINECGKVPYCCTGSKVLFIEFLNKKMSNLLMQMNSYLFDENILKDNYSYFSSLLRSSNQYSFLLAELSDFKKLVLDNKDYDLLAMCSFDEDILIDFEDGKEPQFNQDKLKMYSSLLNVSVGELTNKLKDLLKINDEILNTIHPFMLSQKMNCLSFKNLERLSVYPDLQFKLNQCSQKELMIINRILTYLDNDLDKSYDIITIIYYIINNWDCHRELLQTINSNELTNEELTNLIFILQRKNDFYPIKTVEELEPENFNKLTNQVFKDIEERTLNGNITIEELKRAIFERKYGLDLESVKFIIKRYCQDMEVIRNSDDISERNRIILQSINYIYNIDDLAKLSFLYLTSNKLPYGYSSFIDLDAQIREDYAKRYSNSLYKIKEEHRMKKEDFEKPSLYEKVSKIKYKGRKPQFYVLDGDFNLQIHILGAYREFERPSNFKEDWERPKIAYHGIATSYIANNQIANARQYHPAYGFDSYDAEALIAIQNSDICSDELINQFASSIFQPCCFYPPKEMIDKTRHTHNEFVLERRGDKGSSSYKRLPSYIVYMVDDINNEDNFDIENNELFDESVQAAIDNDIPIVIVDRLKYAKSEKKKYETLLDKFAKQPNLFDMKNILLIVCDNMIGCAKYGLQSDMDYHTYFNQDVLTDVIDKIIDVIEKQSEPNRQNLIIELYKHSLKEPLITGGNQRKINQLYSNLNLKMNIFQESQKDLRKVRQYYDNASEEIKEAIALDIDHGLSYEYVYVKILNGEYRNGMRLK